jgi:hypothetical protein
MVKEASRPATGTASFTPMRPPTSVTWKDVKERLKDNFGIKNVKDYDSVSKEDLLKAYEMMQVRVLASL